MQLNALQKENVRIKADLDHEINNRQTLQLQLDSKEQMILSLKTAIDARGHQMALSDTMVKTPVIMDSIHRTPVKDTTVSPSHMKLHVSLGTSLV